MDLAARPAPAVASGTRAPDRRYAELATRLFQATPRRTVVAFAATHHGEGVTTTVRGLATELVRSGKSVAVLNGALRHVPIPGISTLEAELENRPPILGAPLASEPTAGAAVITGLRERYDCILLDCGSLEDSVDLLRLASVSDGVVIVVEAGRTGQEQVDRAAQVIREAQGTLIGFVLNKRRYPIPGWLYRML